MQVEESKSGFLLPGHFFTILFLPSTNATGCCVGDPVLVGRLVIVWESHVNMLSCCRPIIKWMHYYVGTGRKKCIGTYYELLPVMQNWLQMFLAPKVRKKKTYMVEFLELKTWRNDFKWILEFWNRYRKMGCLWSTTTDFFPEYRSIRSSHWSDEAEGPRDKWKALERSMSSVSKNKSTRHQTYLNLV